MLGLDGYEPTVGKALMAEGRLPFLRDLSERSARFAIDHGPAKYTGLAWEHVSTGLSPDDAKRWAAVFFDPKTYAVWQQPTGLDPFPTSLEARTVVVDAPYYNLARDTRAQGIVAWGTHDPGVRFATRPESLAVEIRARFGPYPSARWIYGFTWPSVENTRLMGEAFVKAIELRAELSRWLLAERFPDWELALVVPTELHSAIEALWHGFDATHPLHGHPSAGPAREALVASYEALDRLVRALVERFPDAAVVAFNMHGMGPNFSDVSSMLLFPELLYRHAFGRGLLSARRDWREANGDPPGLGPRETWTRAVLGAYRDPRVVASMAWRKLATRIAGTGRPPAVDPVSRAPLQPIDWMPAAWYRRHWHRMRAFALPSFYDGRVRVNLAGRERDGIVPRERHAEVCREVEAVARACRDLATGEPVVASVVDRGGRDPFDIDATEADLVVNWRLPTLGFEHPTLGRIGPVPYRRTGGHTGGYGMAWIKGSGLEPGDHGLRSSFDVVPTAIDLLGEARPARLSGRSMLTPLANAAAR
jgi:hypothetical protein